MKLSNLDAVCSKLRDLADLMARRGQLDESFKLHITGENGRTFQVPPEIATADETLRYMRADLESKMKSIRVEIRDLGLQIDDEQWLRNRAANAYF